MAPGMALGRLSPSEVGRRNLRVAWQKLFFLEKKIESAEFFHQSCTSLGALAFGLGNFRPCGVVESHLRRLGGPLPSMKRFFPLIFAHQRQWKMVVYRCLSFQKYSPSFEEFQTHWPTFLGSLATCNLHVQRPSGIVGRTCGSSTPSFGIPRENRDFWWWFAYESKRRDSRYRKIAG